MAERPIIMSGSMVRAILDGRKTQTRRVIGQPDSDQFFRSATIPDDLRKVIFRNPHTGMRQDIALPYAIGDRLYVRENFRSWQGWDCRPPSWLEPGRHSIRYEADKSGPSGIEYGKLRPAIHMPRWASRLTLHVTDVRVQRVQEITKEDALAEGVHPDDQFWKPGKVYAPDMPSHLFGMLWDSLNTKPRPRYAKRDGKRIVTHYESFPWEEGTRVEAHRGKQHFIWGNPWIAAATFDPHQHNIDMERSDAD